MRYSAVHGVMHRTQFVSLTCIHHTACRRFCWQHRGYGERRQKRLWSADTVARPIQRAALVQEQLCRF